MNKASPIRTTLTRRMSDVQMVQKKSDPDSTAYSTLPNGFLRLAFVIFYMLQWEVNSYSVSWFGTKANGISSWYSPVLKLVSRASGIEFLIL